MRSLIDFIKKYGINIAFGDDLSTEKRDQIWNDVIEIMKAKNKKEGWTSKAKVLLPRETWVPDFDLYSFLDTYGPMG